MSMKCHLKYVYNKENLILEVRTCRVPAHKTMIRFRLCITMLRPSKASDFDVLRVESEVCLGVPQPPKKTPHFSCLFFPSLSSLTFLFWKADD